MIIKSNRISPKKFYIFLILFTRAIFTLPFILLQSILYKKKIRNTTLDKPPIFILGHYRSGTTLLHKLLTTDKKFGYISNYDILFSNSSVLLGKRMAFILQKFIQKFNIKNPHFNNSIHYLNDPGEEDMFLISRGSLFSDYWRFLFPLSWDKLIKSNLEKDNRAKQWNNNYNNLLKQFTFQNKGKQLLLKNPPNTGRVIKLLKMFPNAKFIYIHRNPYRLFYSMRNLWNNVIIKYYTLEKLSKNKIDEIIYHDYKKLIVQYEN
ncbi:MAG: sulfotransferase, partial [Ignavibacteria bacterium]|nr:sulfotransferase [Ignavibacteria bacterium]